MAQAEEDFNAPYLFKRNEVCVVIKHSQGLHIRTKPGSPAEVDPNGGTGRLARWITNIREKDGIIESQFKSSNTGEYLRMLDDGKEIDVRGIGGKFCWFRIHFQNIGYYKLESVEFEGKYIAVDKNGIRSGIGGPFCRLNILREGIKLPFSTPYLFMRNNTVVIEHRDCMNMRVENEDGHGLRIDGGTGEFARFEVILGDNGKVQIKSLKNGHYLRIKEGHVDCGGKGGKFTHFKVHPVDTPNQVRLESCEHEGRFVTLDAKHKGFKPSDGSHKSSFLTFYRDD